MTEQQEWYLHAFTDDYLYLYAHRTEKEAEKHVAMAIQHVAFRPGQRILDVACGAGRHMLAFARRGASVIGVDLSDALLKAAEARFRAAHLPARFLKMDMRELAFKNEFEGITLWFTSFGYFQRSADDRKVLQRIERALNSGGWWLIDLPNPAYVRTHLVAKSQREIIGPHGQAGVVEHRQIQGNRVIKHVTITDRQGAREYLEDVHLYSEETFGAFVRAAGLTADGILGNYDGSAFASDSPRQIWYGRK